ncbi:MAG TPA: ABC transporter ATP-binding protein [Flavitalea sp.]|nr:ABC transporter ATP-binding protein [Flavitalea sp.]
MKKLFFKCLCLLEKNEQQKYALLVLSGLLTSFADLFSIGLLVLITGFFTGASGNNLLLLDRWLTNSPVIVLVGFLAFFIIKNMFVLWFQKVQFSLSYTIAARISKESLRQYLSGPYQEFAQNDSSVLIRKISQQPVEFAQYLLAGFHLLFIEIFMLFFVIATLLFINVKLFLLLVVVFVPSILLIVLFSRKKVKHVRNSIRNTSEKSIQYLKEALAGYIESNLFQKSEFFTTRYATKQKQLNGYLAELQTMHTVPARMMEIFAIGGLFFLILLNMHFKEFISINTITLGTFLVAAYRIIPGIVKIINTIQNIKAYSFATENLPTPENTAQALKILQEYRIEKIECRNVSCQYNGIPLLQNINLSFYAGQISCISAPSGKGKTTLLNVLLGFLENEDGLVLINGKPVNSAERKQYWSRISYVKQQPFVLHGSLTSNITLEDTNNSSTVAANFSALTQLTASRGEDVLISDHGRNISGGEQQRVALARALQKDADVFILDEPFNELDGHAIAEIMEHLALLTRKGKMILLVSHDEKISVRCDQIISL